MPNRRNFFKTVAGAAAGVVVGGHSFADAVLGAAQSPAATRRRAMIAGRRVTVVDVHAHTFVPEVWDLVKDTPLAASARNNLTGTIALGPGTAARLQYMDKEGIDYQAINVNAWGYSADRALARDLVQLQNEKIAAGVAAHPDRFVGMATLALQHPDLAADQLEYAVNKLGLRGAAIGGSVEGQELSDRKFDPFWAKAEQLGVLIFIHPQGTPELEASGRLKGSGGLENVIGNPLETTIALSHLIFEGTLDKFPGLKICGAHAGGYLPSYIGRSDKGCETFPPRCTVALKKKPSEYLRQQLYFDSMVFTSEGLRHLIAEVGVSQIVLGTDHPFPWTKVAVDHILDTSGLSDADRTAMLGENAARLLGITS